MTITAKIDAKAVFDHASRFHYAGALMRIEFQEMTAPIIEPYVVISSFSSELYMKCIYAMETGGDRMLGHDLRKLFDALSVDIREELRSNWTEVIQILNETYEKANEPFRLPIDLVSQLDLSGRMFEDMRYFYEGGDFAKHWFLSPLPDLLRRLILIRRPDWAENAALIEGSYVMRTGETDESSRSVGHWSFIAYGIPRPEPVADDDSA